MSSYSRWQIMVVFVGILFLVVFPVKGQDTPNVVEPTIQRRVFREGVIGKPQNLNPLLARDNSIDQDIASLVFEGLIKKVDGGTYRPALALNWTLSDDGLTYIFTLDPNAVWSDGVPFTSDDVEFTINVMKAEEFPASIVSRRLWQTITFRKIDTRSVQIVLPEPFPDFLHFVTIPMLPKHILDDIPIKDLPSHDFSIRPVGTGPFVVESVTDQYTRLSANLHHRAGAPQIESVEFHYFLDEDALYQAFEQDQIDAFWLSYLQDGHNIMDAQIYSATLQKYVLIYLNQRDPGKRVFFQDRSVRQALLQLLDRQAFIDNVYDGQLALINSPLLSTNWAFNPDQLTFEYDYTSAIQALDETSWLYDLDAETRLKDGVPFAFRLLVENESEKLLMAENISQQWRSVGLDVSIEQTDHMTDRLVTGDFDAALVEIHLTNDPDLYGFWHQSQVGEAGQNFSGWIHAEASEMLRQGRLAQAKEQRLPYYYAFQDIFTDEVPALLMYQPMLTYVVRDTIKNVQLPELSVSSNRFNQMSEWMIQVP